MHYNYENQENMLFFMEYVKLTMPLFSLLHVNLTCSKNKKMMSIYHLRMNLSGYGTSMKKQNNEKIYTKLSLFNGNDRSERTRIERNYS